MKNACYIQQKTLLMEYLLQKETKVPATAFLGHEATVLPPRSRDILLKGDIVTYGFLPSSQTFVEKHCLCN